MDRSNYYNNQKFNEYIQSRLKKYPDYTYQKLTEEDDILKKKIKKGF